MAFTAKEYTPANLDAPSGKSGNSGMYDGTIRLNNALSIGGKNAKVGAAKEICVVLVGSFRTSTNYGSIHALRAIDPEDGTEGVLWLNTRLAKFQDGGKEKRFVAGNFEGSCLTTFCKRVSQSVDGGYVGDYMESDGEWELDPEFYGKPVYIGRKAIPKKSGKGSYQVLEWRWCEEEFPQLHEFLENFEEREETRAEAAGKAAPKPKEVPADKPATKQAPTITKKTQTKHTNGKTKEKKAEVKTATEFVDEQAQYIRERLMNGEDPASIVIDLQVMYSMEEGAALYVINKIADAEGEKNEPDPVVSRALELFQTGGTIADVSKILGDEFSSMSKDDKLTATRAAYTLFKSQPA